MDYASFPPDSFQSPPGRILRDRGIAVRTDWIEGPTTCADLCVFEFPLLVWHERAVETQSYLHLSYLSVPSRYSIYEWLLYSGRSLSEGGVHPMSVKSRPYRRGFLPFAFLGRDHLLSGGRHGGLEDCHSRCAGGDSGSARRQARRYRDYCCGVCLQRV